MPQLASRRDRFRRAARVASMVALAALLLVAAAGTRARADEDAADWLRVEQPADAVSSVQLPLVEVRGRAALRGLGAHDFVLVLDLSDSSLQPSGWDVDGDGDAGRTEPGWIERLAAEPELPPGLIERLRGVDFDDSVLAAEIAATRALLARLEEAGSNARVGLVAFSDEARVLAPLGSSPAALLAALDRLRDTFPRDLRGTNFGDAIAVAHRALQPDAERGVLGPPPGREQSILLLSDGAPTLPPHGDAARQHALYAAAAAAAAGIRLLTFELRPPASGDAGVLAEMAARSGGRFERLERPGDAITRLRSADLVGLAALRVVNETTGAAARALRRFPDGSFDGFVELAPGRNRIVFEAETTSGERAANERIVARIDDAPATPAEAAARRAAAAAMLEELRRRTRETALWAEVARERRVRGVRLDLEIETEGAPAPDAQRLP